MCFDDYMTFVIAKDNSCIYSCYRPVMHLNYRRDNLMTIHNYFANNVRANMGLRNLRFNQRVLRREDGGSVLLRTVCTSFVKLHDVVFQ